MKRKLALTVMLVFMASCAWLQSPAGKTETVVISYETIATVAFPTVLVYLQQREKNGSLSGDALASAKNRYAEARALIIKAGDILKNGIGGQTIDASLVPSLLRQAAVILADLSGGNVSGNNLTIPKGDTSK